MKNKPLVKKFQHPTDKARVCLVLIFPDRFSINYSNTQLGPAFNAHRSCNCTEGHKELSKLESERWREIELSFQITFENRHTFQSTMPIGSTLADAEKKWLGNTSFYGKAVVSVSQVF